MIKIIYRPLNDRGWVDPHHADIYMTRGDTLKASLSLLLRDGSEYVPTSSDTVRFAMKKRYKDAEPLVSVEIPHETMILQIDSDDTKDLRFGDYVYDIEITYADGVVDTFLAGNLTLTEEVD